MAGVWTWFTATGSVPAGAWGEVSGTLPVTWSGTLEDAWFVVNSSSSTAELFVDDCSLREVVDAPPPASGDLVNGSFEAGLDGWTVTAAGGGTAACAVLDSQGARDGAHALALGNVNAAGNAILEQTVRTVAGAAVQLRLDYGAFGAAGRQQRLRVDLLDGAAALASELCTALGPGNFLPSGTTFSTRVIPFTATAPAVTLRLADETTLANSNSVDGMLDRIVLVAVAAALAIAPRTLLIVR